MGPQPHPAISFHSSSKLPCISPHTIPTQTIHAAAAAFVTLYEFGEFGPYGFKITNLSLIIENCNNTRLITAIDVVNHPGQVQKEKENEDLEADITSGIISGAEISINWTERDQRTGISGVSWIKNGDRGSR